MSARRCKHCERDRAVPDEIARSGLAVCRACAAERKRARQREWARRPEVIAKRRAYERSIRDKRREVERRWLAAQLTDPEKAARLREHRRKASRRYEQSERGKANRKAARQRVLEDPERAARERERWRRAGIARRKSPAKRHMDAEARRIRDRLRNDRPPVKAVPRDPTYNVTGLPRVVSYAPLAPHVEAWLERWAAEHGRDQLSPVDALCAQAEIPQRRLYGLRHGESRVSYPIADRLCVVLGLSFALIYDLADEREEAA